MRGSKQPQSRRARGGVIPVALACALWLGCTSASSFGGLGGDDPDTTPNPDDSAIGDVAAFDSSVGGDSAAVDSSAALDVGDTSVVVDAVDVGDTLVVVDSGTDTGVDSGVDTGVDTGPDTTTTCTAPKSACGAACVDLTKDEKHCGDCATVCARFATCSTSHCACPDTTNSVCSDACVDTSNSAAACGSCSTKCARAQYCSPSPSGPDCTCEPGFDACGAGNCVDFKGDAANCGKCGHVCSGGHCVAGECQDTDPCRTGRSECSSGGAKSCFDLKNDPTHCGACDKQCAVSEVCVAGNCRSYIPALGCTAAPCDATCSKLISGSKACNGFPGQSNSICVAGGACPTPLAP